MVRLLKGTATRHVRDDKLSNFEPKRIEEVEMGQDFRDDDHGQFLSCRSLYHSDRSASNSVSVCPNAVVAAVFMVCR